MDWVGAVYSIAPHIPEGGKTMFISMNITSSRRMTRRWENFSLDIRKRLAKAFERLSLNISADVARRTAQRELMNREMRQCELSYDARKRKLLAALRDKISEKRMKIK